MQAKIIAIVRKLVAFVDRRMPRTIQSGTVTAVDANTRTCTVDPGDGRLAWQDVRLQSVGSLGEGFFIKPKVGSSVLVALIDNDKANLCVVHTAEVDKIELNGNQYKGLVKVDDLVDKLNALENRFNNILTAFNSHTHIATIPVLNTPTPTAVPVPVLTDAPIVPTLATELTNDTVTHG